MSALRARCPHCRTLTAVAFDDVYECHSCGAAFAAGLVRVPRAFGKGGEAMEQAAATELPYPEALVVDRDSLDEQSHAIAGGLPQRPLVLGGCCCAHIGAIRGLATRHDRLAVVWLDAHGDLNTPESSPSGNLWGMPLRMTIDEGTVRIDDVALVGARDLDPPEREYVAEHGIDDDLARTLEGVEAVYVALDVDVLRAGRGPGLHARTGRPRARRCRAAAARGLESRTRRRNGIHGARARRRPGDPRPLRRGGRALTDRH